MINLEDIKELEAIAERYEWILERLVTTVDVWESDGNLVLPSIYFQGSVEELEQCRDNPEMAIKLCMEQE